MIEHNVKTIKSCDAIKRSRNTEPKTEEQDRSSAAANSTKMDDKSNLVDSEEDDEDEVINLASSQKGKAKKTKF